jgi:hypothetical protein
MLTTGLNALALGFFRGFHGGGDSLVWLFGLVIVGAVVWALVRPSGNNDPAKNT